jgi:hypothetical protein
MCILLDPMTIIFLFSIRKVIKIDSIFTFDTNVFLMTIFWMFSNRESSRQFAIMVKPFLCFMVRVSDDSVLFECNASLTIWLNSENYFMGKILFWQLMKLMVNFCFIKFLFCLIFLLLVQHSVKWNAFTPIDN